MINLFDVSNHYLKNKKRTLKKIDEVLSSGKYILGENVNIFEKNLKDFVGSKYCVSVSNGTDALEVSLRSLQLNRNDEVIVPSFTWISTASAVKLTGAKPVFCDIELDTYGIDYNYLNKLINKRTKAVIIVSLYGQISKDIFKIKKLCEKNKIILIEDAAQSFGAEYRNYNSCNIAHISTTSFFPTKSLGGYGDAGAIFTNNKKLHNRIRLIKQNGTLNKKDFLILGRNARLDELQAVLLIDKLKNFNNVLKTKRATANFYISKLKDYFKIFLLKNNYPSYSLFTMRHSKRDKIFNHLKNEGISAGIYYRKNLHEFDFLNKKKYYLINSKIASQQVISIPVHENLSLKEKKTIVEKLIKKVKGFSY
jgi:UDP-2-acetamido-2-deoxy-ribo-hexuluronate aminotransferase